MLIAIFLVFVTGCRKVFLSVCSNVTARKGVNCVGTYHKHRAVSDEYQIVAGDGFKQGQRAEEEKNEGASHLDRIFTKVREDQLACKDTEYIRHNQPQ